MRKINVVKLTRSSRRHIRERKGAIRRSTADPAERARRITELYAKFGVANR